jgi:Ni,Fe-hydrogenase III large subunit/Ni,Fe-hydrogenase III component G
MTTSAFERAIAALPGLITSEAPRGDVWHAQVRPDLIVDAMQQLLGEQEGSILLASGEDRVHRDEMRVHFLVGCGGDPLRLVHVEAVLPRDRPSVPTLAALSFPASRFEREMQDLFGILPVGHPDPRPLVRHGFWPASFHPMRDDAITPVFEDDGRPFPFTPVGGAGVYEIPVGPVHAAVIEPGHFRFSVLGETILKMRARLYFTHKGTEKLFAGRLPDDGTELAERISGDTSAGHALAYCQAIETLAATNVPLRARLVRTVLLELERIYNHITDAGGILADTGFPVAQSHCLRIRESVLRLNKAVTGHRLLRGAIVPGGVSVDVPDGSLAATLDRLVTDFEEMTTIARENTLVRDRLDDTGTLPADIARDFGVVGYVARACGIAHDVRADRPFAAYDRLRVTPIVERAGDVDARLVVRIREVRQSVQLIAQALDVDSPPALRAAVGPLPAFAAGFGIVEAWRGRLIHLVIANEQGRLHRVKVVDPSFFNWPALARALDGNIVPDFPLCNKSFNQSYSGNDL